MSDSESSEDEKELKQSSEDVDSDDESEEEVKKVTKKKVTKKESSSEEESESEEEVEVKKVTKVVKKVAKKESSSEEESESEEEVEVKKVTKVTKKVVKKESSEEEESEDENEMEIEESEEKESENLIEEKEEEKEEEEEDEEGVEHEIYFGELNFDTTEDDLQEYFGACGTITQCKLLKRPDGRSRGRGFIKFSSKRALNEALKLNDQQFMGRRIVVQVPQNKSFTQDKFYNQVQPDQGQSANLIIRNLSFHTTEDKLREIFGQCGPIKRCRVIQDAEGNSRGFGFVDF